MITVFEIVINPFFSLLSFQVSEEDFFFAYINYDGSHLCAKMVLVTTHICCGIMERGM